MRRPSSPIAFYGKNNQGTRIPCISSGYRRLGFSMLRSRRFRSQWRLFQYILLSPRKVQISVQTMWHSCWTCSQSKKMQLLLPPEIVSRLVEVLTQVGAREIGGVLMGEHVGV